MAKSLFDEKLINYVLSAWYKIIILIETAQFKIIVVVEKQRIQQSHRNGQKTYVMKALFSICSQTCALSDLCACIHAGENEGWLIKSLVRLTEL